MEALVGSVSGRRADALDWWPFAFYAGGMRFGDLVTLRRSGVEWDGDPGAGVPPTSGGGCGRRTTPYVFGMVTAETERNAEALFKSTNSFNALVLGELKEIARRAAVR